MDGNTKAFKLEQERNEILQKSRLAVEHHQHLTAKNNSEDHELTDTEAALLADCEELLQTVEPLVENIDAKLIALYKQDLKQMLGRIAKKDEAVAQRAEHRAKKNGKQIEVAQAIPANAKDIEALAQGGKS